MLQRDTSLLPSPIKRTGTTYQTHSLVHCQKDTNLKLEPSTRSKLMSYLCALAGTVLLGFALLHGAREGEILDLLFISVGAFTLLFIATKIYQSETFLFEGNSRCIRISEGVLSFNKIESFRVLSKVVGGSSKSEPFPSGELQLVTKTGTAYLLSEGRNISALLQIAKQLGDFTDTKVEVYDENFRTL